MAYDAGMARAVCVELAARFCGAKIEKIYQPSSDEILLLCRRHGESRKLLLSASASGARVCETAATRENPKTPPMFCMQLRKHLTGAVITGISTPGFERVIEIARTDSNGNKTPVTRKPKTAGPQLWPASWPKWRGKIRFPAPKKSPNSKELTTK